MPNMVFIDPFEINAEKMTFFNQVLAALDKHFPQHRPCHSHLYIGNYHYLEGYPNITKTENNITNIRFGVLTPTPPDTRKRLFYIPLGELPTSQVIGALHLVFKKNQAYITDVEISVFGQQFKTAFVKFANEFRHDALLSTVKNVFVTVESELPRNL